MSSIGRWRLTWVRRLQLAEVHQGETLTEDWEKCPQRTVSLALVCCAGSFFNQGLWLRQLRKKSFPLAVWCSQGALTILCTCVAANSQSHLGAIHLTTLCFFFSYAAGFAPLSLTYGKASPGGQLGGIFHAPFWSSAAWRSGFMLMEVPSFLKSCHSKVLWAWRLSWQEGVSTHLSWILIPVSFYKFHLCLWLQHF